MTTERNSAREDSSTPPTGYAPKAEPTETSIGKIGNYYGGLSVRSDGTRHEWGIENYDGTDWEEIPESLYSALTAFEASRRNCIKTVNI